MSTTEDRLAGASAGRGDNGSGEAAGADTVVRQLPLAAYVPMGVTSTYKRPKATVDPDSSKTWLRRAYPVVASHKASLPYRHHPVLRRPGHSGPDPRPPQSRHRQLAREAHRAPALLRRVGAGARAGRGGGGLHLANRPVQDGLRHRVRPAQRHLRAPHPYVVPVLRPRAVGTADLPGQLGHPLGADVPHLRAAHSGPVLHRPGGLRLHALHQRGAGPGGHGHHALHLLDRACACARSSSPCPG